MRKLTLISRVLLLLLVPLPLSANDPKPITLEELRQRVLEARQSIRSGNIEINTEVIEGDDVADATSTTWFNGDLYRVDRDARLPLAGRGLAILTTGQDRYRSYTILGPDEFAELSTREITAGKRPVVKIAPIDRIAPDSVLPIDVHRIGWRLGSQWNDDPHQVETWPLVHEAESISLEAVTYQGSLCWKVRYVDSRKADVRVTVAPESGYQVVLVTASGTDRSMPLEERLEIVVRQAADSEQWYPVSTRYQREQDGELRLEERNEITVVGINQEQPRELFLWESLNIPEEFPRRRMLESGDYETSADDRLFSFEPGTSSNSYQDREKSMAIFAGLAKAIIFFLIMGYLARRKLS